MTIMFHNANKRYMYILEQAKTGTKGKFSDMHHVTHVRHLEFSVTNPIVTYFTKNLKII